MVAGWAGTVARPGRTQRLGADVAAPGPRPIEAWTEALSAPAANWRSTSRPGKKLRCSRPVLDRPTTCQTVQVLPALPR